MKGKFSHVVLGSQPAFHRCQTFHPPPPSLSIFFRTQHVGHCWAFLLDFTPVIFPLFANLLSPSGCRKLQPPSAPSFRPFFDHFLLCPNAPPPKWVFSSPGSLWTSCDPPSWPVPHSPPLKFFPHLKHLLVLIVIGSSFSC